jgi:hypothetical protein
VERDASIRAWRFEPLPEIRTVTQVTGGSWMVCIERRLQSN